MDDLAATVDHELRSGEAAGVDIAALQVLIDAGERGSRHSSGFGGSGGRGEHRTGLRNWRAGVFDSRKVCPIPTACAYTRPVRWCRLKVPRRVILQDSHK